MDKTAQEFARKIISLLEHISRGLVSGIHTREQNEQANYQQENTNKKNNTTEIHPVVAPKPAPTEYNPKSPEKRWYRRVPWWKVIEGVGVASVVFYARITYLQWHDSNANFRLDQRAWIGISSINLEEPFENDDPIRRQPPDQPPRIFATNFGFSSANIVITNTGKTPALGVIVYCCVLSGLSEDQPMPTGDPFPNSPATTRLAPENFRVQGIALPPAAQQRIGMFDEKISFGTAFAYPHHGIVYLRGKITYRDIFYNSVDHTTQFCFMRAVGKKGPVEFRHCRKGNSVN